MELKKQIQDIIDAYNENYNGMRDEIRKLIFTYTNDSIYNQSAADDFIRKGTDEIRKSRGEMNKLLNKSLQDVISRSQGESIKVLYPETEKPNEYSVRIANALEFIKIQGKNITDESSLMILKEFMQDYDTMKLFQAAIDKQTELIDKVGKSKFPLTFFKVNKMDVILNMFSEMRELAQRTFIYEGIESAPVLIKGTPYWSPAPLNARSYKTLLNEANIMNHAEMIDEIIAEATAA